MSSKAQIEPQQLPHKTSIRKVIRTTLPVFFGYLPMGMAFGLLMADQGYAWYWASLMGIVIFAGAAQFMAVGLLAANAGMLEVAITTLLLNSRHIFYGLSLIHHLKAKGLQRFYIIFGLTDETYSLLTAHIAKKQAKSSSLNEDESRFQFLVTAFNQSYWVAGCTLGALLGSAMSFDTTGLDFTLPALFMVLVIEQYKVTGKLFPFFIALVCAVFTLAVFDSNSMLLISITLTLILLLGGRRFFNAGATQ